MTAKQQFYLLCKQGRPTKAQVKEFVSSHHSVQWRERGKSIIEVKFSDRESWVSVDSFADNHHNKVKKQLNDLILSSSCILTHGDVWDVMSDSFKQAAREFVQPEQTVTLEEYESLRTIHNELVAKFNKRMECARELQEENKRLKYQVQRLNYLIDESHQKLEKALGSVIISKSDVQEVKFVLERK